jgi:hypothetical protein
VRVHLAREHALELELGHFAVDAAEVVLDRLRRARVRLGLRQVEQFTRLGQPLPQLVERRDDAFELGPLAAEFLSTVGLLPDGGVFEFAQDLGQPLALAIVVKGTPSAHRCAA